MILSITDTTLVPNNKKMKLTASTSIESVSNKSSNSSTAASQWTNFERIKHNIKFNANATSTLDQKFEAFFGQPLEKDVPPKFKFLRDVVEKDREGLDATGKRLFDSILDFDLKHSENSVRLVMQNLLHIMEFTPTTNEKVTYETPDLVIHTMLNNIKYVQCVIEMKRGGSYDFKLRATYRLQLIAYILSMAVENAKLSDVLGAPEIKVQTLFGLLQIGLTPVIYKVNIPSSYVNSLINNDYASLTELVVEEFVNVEPYTDREFLRLQSHNVIVNIYSGLKQLMDRTNFI